MNEPKRLRQPHSSIPNRPRSRDFANFIVLLILLVQLSGPAASAQPPHHSPECQKAASACENDTACVHRLAILQSACVTNTCQPQCREAALNLYQNREGRALLRTDASCVPGRYELEKCGFLPNKSPKHCSFAKLICETDLACDAKWNVFMTECDTLETNDLRCSEKCWRHLNDTLGTTQGTELATCTCTDKEDNRCLQLQDRLRTCLTPVSQQQPAHTDSEDVPLARPSPPVDHRTPSPNDVDVDLDLAGDVPAGASPLATATTTLAAFLAMALSLLLALAIC